MARDLERQGKACSLGRALHNLLRSWGVDGKIRERQAAACWNEVVGPQIAQRTDVLRVEDGKMFVQVHSSSWRTELVFMKSDIIRRLNQKVGRRIIQDIVFVSMRNSASASSGVVEEGGL